MHSLTDDTHTHALTLTHILLIHSLTHTHILSSTPTHTGTRADSHTHLPCHASVPQYQTSCVITGRAILRLSLHPFIII